MTDVANGVPEAFEVADAPVPLEAINLVSQASGRNATKEEVALWLLSPPEARTAEQVAAIGALLPHFPKLQGAGDAALTSLARQITARQLERGEVLFRNSDAADPVYLVLDGIIALIDPNGNHTRQPQQQQHPQPQSPTNHLRAGGLAGFGGAPSSPRRVTIALPRAQPPAAEQHPSKTKEDVLQRCIAWELVGDELLIAGLRWPCRVQVESARALLLVVPRTLFHDTIALSVRAAFNRKLEFLARLPGFGTMPRRVLERLAPFFFEVELAPKDLLCRQGDPADCMWAIVTGRCYASIDPHWSPAANRLAETDPRKTSQVAAIQTGDLIGEMCLFGNVRHRAATVRCATTVLLYRLKRNHFLRICPPAQLEELRATAEAKMMMLVSAQRDEMGATNLLNRVLRGHSLRALLPTSRAQLLRNSIEAAQPSSGLASPRGHQNRAGVAGALSSAPESPEISQPASPTARGSRAVVLDLDADAGLSPWAAVNAAAAEWARPLLQPTASVDVSAAGMRLENILSHFAAPPEGWEDGLSGDEFTGGHGGGRRSLSEGPGQSIDGGGDAPQPRRMISGPSMARRAAPAPIHVAALPFGRGYTFLQRTVEKEGGDGQDGAAGTSYVVGSPRRPGMAGSAGAAAVAAAAAAASTEEEDSSTGAAANVDHQDSNFAVLEEGEGGSTSPSLGEHMRVRFSVGDNLPLADGASDAHSAVASDNASAMATEARQDVPDTEAPVLAGGEGLARASGVGEDRDGDGHGGGGSRGSKTGCDTDTCTGEQQQDPEATGVGMAAGGDEGDTTNGVADAEMDGSNSGDAGGEPEDDFTARLLPQIPLRLLPLVDLSWTLGPCNLLNMIQSPGGPGGSGSSPGIFEDDLAPLPAAALASLRHQLPQPAPPHEKQAASRSPRVLSTHRLLDGDAPVSPRERVVAGIKPRPSVGFMIPGPDRSVRPQYVRGAGAVGPPVASSTTSPHVPLLQVGRAPSAPRKSRSDTSMWVPAGVAPARRSVASAAATHQQPQTETDLSTAQPLPLAPTHRPPRAWGTRRVSPSGRRSSSPESWPSHEPSYEVAPVIPPGGGDGVAAASAVGLSRRVSRASAGGAAGLAGGAEAAASSGQGPSVEVAGAAPLDEAGGAAADHGSGGPSGVDAGAGAGASSGSEPPASGAAALGRAPSRARSSAASGVFPAAESVGEGSSSHAASLRRSGSLAAFITEGAGASLRHSHAGSIAVSDATSAHPPSRQLSALGDPEGTDDEPQEDMEQAAGEEEAAAADEPVPAVATAMATAAAKQQQQSNRQHRSTTDPWGGPGKVSTWAVVPLSSTAADGGEEGLLVGPGGSPRSSGLAAGVGVTAGSNLGSPSTALPTPFSQHGHQTRITTGLAGPTGPHAGGGTHLPLLRLGGGRNSSPVGLRVSGGLTGATHGSAPPITAVQSLATRTLINAAAAAVGVAPSLSLSGSASGASGLGSVASTSGSSTANALAALLVPSSGRTSLPATVRQPTVIVKGGFVWKAAGRQRGGEMVAAATAEGGAEGGAGVTPRRNAARSALNMWGLEGRLQA